MSVKKRAKTIGIVFSALLFAGAFGFIKNKAGGNGGAEGMRPSGDPYVSNELVGVFDTRGEAETAAGLYGIELASYSDKVAVFKCEGDPGETIERGRKNGWPELSQNQVYSAY